MRTCARMLSVFALCLVSYVAESQPMLFGTTEFRAQSLAALPQWQRTLRQIESEKEIYKACAEGKDCPSRRIATWQAMIRNQEGHLAIEQINAVNHFVNDFRYKDDARNYGRRDYWATPLEFLRRSGDCEDYAIIKYVTLRQLGFSVEALRLVVVQDVVRDLAHAVLAVYMDDQVYILDNILRDVVSQERLRQYIPYYSINEQNRWVHVKAYEPPPPTLSGEAK